MLPMVSTGKGAFANSGFVLVIWSKHGGIFLVIGQELLVFIAHDLWANMGKTNGMTVMESNLWLTIYTIVDFQRFDFSDRWN